MSKIFQVHVSWDEEAHVWFVQNSDVPGLSAEAATLDEMHAELKYLVPELLTLNGVIQKADGNPDKIPWQLISGYNEKARAAG